MVTADHIDSQGGVPTTAPGPPDRIVCGTQYRPNSSSMAGAVDPTLTMERTDRTIGNEQTLRFPNMTVRVRYTAGAPDGNGVNLAVDTSGGQPLMSTLYQVGEPMIDEIRFGGGHGFTGLHYVYYELAMLQVWCRAERDR